MKRGVSLYLDLLRFLAAFVVLLQHLSWGHFSGGLLWQIRPYGAQAVIVFFVLSGYVIGHATGRPGDTPRRYAVDRLARIYSVVLPAVLLTLALDAAGSRLRPELYAEGWIDDAPIWLQLPGSLLFLNQIWSIDLHPGSNVPYWSMGYEVWYYAAFAMLVFLPRRWALPAAAGVLALTGPRVAFLFPVWLLGVAAYRLSSRALPPLWSRALFFGAPALLLAFELWRSPPNPPIPVQSWPTSAPPRWSARSSPPICSARRAAPWLARWLEPWARPIRFLAGRSFSLYLFQLPVMQFLLCLMPWPATAWASRIALVAGTIASVLVLAEFTEQRRNAWRRLFDWLLPASAHAPHGAVQSPGQSEHDGEAGGRVGRVVPVAGADPLERQPDELRRQHVRGGPDEGGQDVGDQEPRALHAGHAGDQRHGRAQHRHEPAQRHAHRAVALEEQLGPADQKRPVAERPDAPQPRAVSGADPERDEIADYRTDDRDDQERRHRQPGRRRGAGDRHQDRRSGDQDAEHRDRLDDRGGERDQDRQPRMGGNERGTAGNPRPHAPT